MMRKLLRLATDRNGSSAAELALSLPIFMALLFGTFELGHYFLSEHVVQKAVRDAARYAARLPVSNYDCATLGVDDTAELQIQRVARSGDPDGDADGDGIQDQRLEGWTTPELTTVTMTCDASGTYGGIYDDFPDGAPVVTVAASVPYPSLFGTLGIGVPSLLLNARSQSAVFGA